MSGILLDILPKFKSSYRKYSSSLKKNPEIFSFENFELTYMIAVLSEMAISPRTWQHH